MKIVISEGQLKKVVDSEIDERSRSFAFTRKKRLFPNVAKKYAYNRFSFYNRELDEIVVTDDDINDDIDLNEKESKKIIDISKLIKSSGGYSYYFFEDYPDIYIYVYDISSKIIVGIFSFEINGNDYHVLYPLIKKDWRGKNIGSEVYKILLTKGNIVSGGEQTRSAIGLWRKLIKTTNNKVIYFDGKNKYDVYLKGDEIYSTKNDKSIYGSDEIGADYLKIYKSTI